MQCQLIPIYMQLYITKSIISKKVYSSSSYYYCCCCCCCCCCWYCCWYVIAPHMQTCHTCGTTKYHYILNVITPRWHLFKSSTLTSYLKTYCVYWDHIKTQDQMVITLSFNLSKEVFQVNKCAPISTFWPLVTYI